MSTHDGCCCPATLTAAFQFNAIVNMQYLTFTLSLVYIYLFIYIYIYVCFQFNTIVNMQYLYYTILSVYLNIYTYIHTYIYIYIMNLNNIPMLHFVFQPLLQRQFSCLSRTTLRLQGDLGPYPLQPIPQPDWKKPSTRCKSVWCGHHAVRV